MCQTKPTIMKTLQLTLLCCFVSVLSFGTVSTKEKDALVAIYNATNGASWNTTWNLDAPVHTWFGVVVSEDKVVELNLQLNNLQGALPNAIGDLVHLQTLNLFRNAVSGTIPASIGNLKNLKELNLAFNKIEGELPNTLAELSNLQSLQLFMNRLTGEIPASIGQL